jgi:hypothetical protein
MVRRNKDPPRLKVRVSHEASRRGKACVTAAFECLVPIVERQAARQPGSSQDAIAATPRLGRPLVRRR